MDADTIFKLALVALGGGILVRTHQLACWVGELRTKVDVMWGFLSNDMHADLQKRLDERKKEG